MKGYIFASNPSDQVSIPFWSLTFGILFTAAGGMALVNPQFWWGALLFLLIGLHNLTFWVRSYRKFRDVFVDMGGVTIVNRDVEHTFRWQDVVECSKVRWQPLAMATFPRIKEAPFSNRPNVYRLSLSRNVTVYFNDTCEGQLLDHEDTMAGLIRRKMSETRGHLAGAI